MKSPVEAYLPDECEWQSTFATDDYNQPNGDSEIIKCRWVIKQTVRRVNAEKEITTNAFVTVCKSIAIDDILVKDGKRFVVQDVAVYSDLNGFEISREVVV